MKKCTAFVFGGGGSHGALQVGAVRALFEAGVFPDLLVGTSIGAVNATGLALWGMDSGGLAALENAWEKVSTAQFLDPRITKLILRAAVGHPSERSRVKVEEFFISLGITRELRFTMLPRVRLAIVSADIETGDLVIYGNDPRDLILEGLLASIALPPWFTPFHKDGQSMVDGGALSNLPIQAALQLGATEILALDLDDPTLVQNGNPTISNYIGKYFNAVSRRHVNLELALAEAKGVPVRLIEFHGLAPRPTWDFCDYLQLMAAGYIKTRSMLEIWDRKPRPQARRLDFQTTEQDSLCETGVLHSGR